MELAIGENRTKLKLSSVFKTLGFRITPYITPNVEFLFENHACCINLDTIINKRAVEKQVDRKEEEGRKEKEVEGEACL